MHTHLFHYFDQFHSISESAKWAMEKIILTKAITKNEIIQQPGTKCRTLYFVLDGIARIYYLKDIHDVTEHFSFKGHLIIRAESLFTNMPTQKGIQALTDLMLVGIPAQPFFHLFSAHPDIEKLFHKIIVREYITTIKRVESLQYKSATERYHELLSETELVNYIPLKYIASYLGITQVSLSRIRSKM